MGMSRFPARRLTHAPILLLAAALLGCGLAPTADPEVLDAVDACPADTSCELYTKCGTGMCATACADDQLRCGTSCFDVRVDSANCGACGVVCPRGSVCDGGGHCAPTCVPGHSVCGDLCVDVRSSREHCGACSTPCAPGFVCDGAGVCALSCQAELTPCGGVCVDLRTNRYACGQCALRCPDGFVCDGSGECALSCQVELIECNGLCVNLDSDRENCGDCANRCAAGMVCDGTGSCSPTCATTHTECPQGCANLDSDLRNCGACEVTCASGEICDDGRCAPTCAEGTMDCGTGCVDTRLDRRHCGACSQACEDGFVCDLGVCRGSCQGQLRICDERCTDVRVDPDHCGGCDRECPAGHGTPWCDDGACRIACEPWWGDCDGDQHNGCETSLRDNPQHCGRCDQACLPSATVYASCAYGMCSWTCSAGMLDCDGRPENGCETDEALCPACDCHWWNTAWPYRRRLVVDNTQQTESLLDFAVLVTLDASTFDYTHAMAHGEDLRFVDASGVPLPFEIEAWDASGASFVWVLVPSIAAATTTDIWLYYGNLGATRADDPSAVWSPGYGGVWHLNNDLSDAATPLADDGVDMGSVTTPGVIAAARAFDGVGTYFDVTSTSDIRLLGDLTISTWVRFESLDTGAFFNELVCFGTGGESRTTNYLYMIALYDDLTVLVDWEFENAKNAELVTTVESPMLVNTWHHLVVVRDATTMVVRVYVDGAQVGDGLPFSSPATDGASSALRVGASCSNPATWNLHGALDELRIAGRVVSGDWVRTDYLSSSGQLVTVGLEHAR